MKPSACTHGFKLTSPKGSSNRDNDNTYGSSKRDNDTYGSSNRDNDSYGSGRKDNDTFGSSGQSGLGGSDSYV
jgi:hypothetical protein